MKKILKFAAIAVLALASISCKRDYDMEGYFKFNDITLDDKISFLDIDWRDAQVNIISWDSPYIRLVDNGDETCPSWYRFSRDRLYIRYSDNNYKSYRKTLTVYLPIGMILDEIHIDSVSAFIYADVDARDVDIDSVSGDVHYSTWYQPRHVDIDTTSGDVYIALPADFGFRCEFDTLSGGWRSEFRVVDDGTYLIYGDGYSRINVDTTSGNLNLLYNLPL